MTLYGYARVSSIDQDLSIQQEALQKAGCGIIRAEKRSGTKLDGRDELKLLLEFIQTGDVLVVTRLDRLARSMLDLQTIVKVLQDKGASLRCTEQPIDMTTASGKAFLGMLSVFSEFETNLRRERQMEGIAKAKANGVYKGKGRPKAIDDGKIRGMLAAGIRVKDIVAELGCSRVAVYRATKCAA
jgi:DNA invertase Pin-like site-specific DNA recombinase